MHFWIIFEPASPKPTCSSPVSFSSVRSSMPVSLGCSGARLLVWRGTEGELDSRLLVISSLVSTAEVEEEPLTVPPADSGWSPLRSPLPPPPPPPALLAVVMVDGCAEAREALARGFCCRATMVAIMRSMGTMTMRWLLRLKSTAPTASSTSTTSVVMMLYSPLSRASALRLKKAKAEPLLTERISLTR